MALGKKEGRWSRLWGRRNPSKSDGVGFAAVHSGLDHLASASRGQVSTVERRRSAEVHDEGDHARLTNILEEPEAIQ